MKHLRLASEVEINAIRDKSDLMPNHTQVYAIDTDKGEVDIAVVRNCFEANPVIWGQSTNDVKRARFVWGLEERLLGAGIDRYYVQIDAADERWQKVIENWGYERVSPIPEFRYLRVIK